MRCVVLGALVLDLIATLPDRHVATSHHAASSRVLKYSTRTNHRLFAGALDRALRGLNFDHLLLGLLLGVVVSQQQVVGLNPIKFVLILSLYRF